MPPFMVAIFLFLLAVFLLLRYLYVRRCGFKALPMLSGLVSIAYAVWIVLALLIPRISNSDIILAIYFGLLVFDSGYALIARNLKAQTITAWMVLYTSAWAWFFVLMNADGTKLHWFHEFCLGYLPLIGFVWLIALVLVNSSRRSKTKEPFDPDRK